MSSASSLYKVDPVNVQSLKVPLNSQKAYELTYQLEVGLRELIIETGEKIAGPKWWKQRVPETPKHEVKQALTKEREYFANQVPPG